MVIDTAFDIEKNLMLKYTETRRKGFGNMISTYLSLYNGKLHRLDRGDLYSEKYNKSRPEGTGR